MELEARVTTLEQELKVLKNEIQNVLLEIQEFLLSATYPALSGEGVEETSPDAATMAPAEATSARATVAVSETNGHASTQADLLIAALGTPRSEDAPQGANGTPVHGRAVEPNLGALMAWVSKSVERLGKTRTQQLLSLWEKSEQLPERWLALLQQLIALSAGENEPEEVSFHDMAAMIVELEQILGPAANHVPHVMRSAPA